LCLQKQEQVASQQKRALALAPPLVELALYYSLALLVGD